MEKEFVTYEQALSLKELGFHEECFAWYNYGELLEFGNDHILDMYAGEDKKPVAPLKQQVFRWFREKYNLEGIVQRAEDWLWYKFGIYNLYKDCKIMISAKIEFKTYEEAENACIDKLIEIAKQQTNDKD
jgi:hypothetical protein